MEIDTTKDNVIITVYSEDIKKLMNGEMIYPGLIIRGKSVVIDYVVCKQCQDRFIKANKKKRLIK